MDQRTPPSHAASSAARETTWSADEAPILRFLTCGSVDDGKSTLIGRLLFEANQIFEDTLQSLERESLVHGTTGEDVDFALLVDGLQAEREQGITIDVAYRYFQTEKRKFIVADTPGHEQYTRNMVTGASRSDAAIILVDARKGILRQTRRHSCIVHLLGIRNVIVAINKMDLVGYDEARFREIDETYRAFARDLGLTGIVTIPLSALKGDNLCYPSTATPWYGGPTLLQHLENVEVETAAPRAAFRMPVQWVCRPDHQFRGYAGTVCSGAVRVGDPVVAVPSGRPSSVARIVTFDGDRDEAVVGDAVVLTLADELDIARGDIISASTDRPEVADQFQASIVWMSAKPMLPGRPYIIQHGTQRTNAQVSSIRHCLSMDTLEKISARKLELNDVAVCNISTARPLVATPYAENKTLGSFILIDRLTNETVGAGMIDYALRRAQNVHWHSLSVTKHQRAATKAQKACCLWFTGLSGSGKSTVANILETRLQELGAHAYILDGDNVRHGLNRDLGFTDADRVENIRRVAEVGRLMTDAGLITLVSFISPFRAERQLARERFDEDEFIEIFIDTPLEVCEQRDPKGLYRKARAGEIANFTGISSPYEPPERPELHLDGAADTPEVLANRIIDELVRRGIIHGA